MTEDFDWDKEPEAAKVVLTADQVNQLKAMAQVGAPVADIALSLRVAEDGLIAGYRTDLEEGYALGRVKLRNTLNKFAEKDPDVALTVAREQLGGFSRNR